ncbi:YitT family protein [Sporosarcina sp. 179-K 3D1 HS]|uniref:YitT family protein n=1 Tax=Sporosarcina sp. 179-K 3D1 HS TaxID=3232169 RepID=UPI00399F7252
MYFIQKAIRIMIGSLFVAIGINFFLVPFGLLEGGALGISLIFHYLFDVKVGLTFLVISLPIFFLAWMFYRPFFYNGIHGMLLSSLIIDLLHPLHQLGGIWIPSPLFSAIGGGIVIGIGIGFMLRADISLGGTDLLAQMMAKRLRMNAGIMIFCFDILIVTIGSYVLQSVSILLSITTVLSVGMTTSLMVAAPSIRRARLQYRNH